MARNEEVYIAEYHDWFKDLVLCAHQEFDTRQTNYFIYLLQLERYLVKHRWPKKIRAKMVLKMLNFKKKRERSDGPKLEPRPLPLFFVSI